MRRTINIGLLAARGLATPVLAQAADRPPKNFIVLAESSAAIGFALTFGNGRDFIGTSGFRLELRPSVV